jgi:hypothetical protein
MTETAFTGFTNIVKEWNDGESRAYCITRSTETFGRNPNWHCGYIMFPKCPMQRPGYMDFLAYTPVHGGLTYAQEMPGTGRYVYGFDCAHGGDEYNDDLKDIEWLTAECERMGAFIELAIPYEPAYLAAETDEEKAPIIDAYREACKSKNELASEDLGFIANINVIFGGL